MSTHKNVHPIQKFPPYIPLYYRWYLTIRKVYRQTMVRVLESKAAQNMDSVGANAADGVWEGEQADNRANPVSFINKSAHWIEEDLNRADIKAVAAGLAAVQEKMNSEGLFYCSAAGTFVKSTYNPLSIKKKLWEDAWVLHHADVKPGMMVLDIGGASTPFSFYLADRGCAVKVIDNDWGCCGTIFNANHVAKSMAWNLNALDRDVSNGLPFEDNSFDRVFSICVIEHLTSQTRQGMMREIKRVLKPGGIAGFTTDYDHERKVLITDKGLRFGYLRKFKRDVLDPLGLDLIGNRDLIDIKPKENFLGAFFLRKN